MTLKTTDHSIDLSGLSIRDYNEEEVKGFRRVRGEYSNLFHPILQALSEKPQRLSLPGIDYKELLQQVEQILELEAAEAWLSKKQEMVSETRRATLSAIKPNLDKLTNVARTISASDNQLGDLFAKLFDYLGEPQKKATATRKKKQS